MEEENQQKFENLRREVNNYQEEVRGIKENIDNFIDGVEEDLDGGNPGDYFARENGHSQLETIQKDIHRFEESAKDVLGLLLYADEERTGTILRDCEPSEELVDELAEDISELGEFYDQTVRSLDLTAKKYLEELEREETEIYGGRTLDDMLPPEGLVQQDGKEIYFPGRETLSPVEKLSAVSNELKRTGRDYSGSGAEAAADD